MKNSYNQLRLHRKQHRLTQSDLAYLLNLKDNSSISRCESGRRSPSVDILLGYHLLFDTQLGSFFVEQREHIKSRIISRIRPLMTLIENEPRTSKTLGRMEFLEDAFKKLKRNSI